MRRLFRISEMTPRSKARPRANGEIKEWASHTTMARCAVAPAPAICANDGTALQPAAPFRKCLRWPGGNISRRHTCASSKPVVLAAHSGVSYPSSRPRLARLSAGMKTRIRPGFALLTGGVALLCAVFVFARSSASQAVAPERSRVWHSWEQRGFRDFARGTFDASGANLYVSAKGVLQLINRWDLNQDGYLDLFFSNTHDVNYVQPARIFYQGQN